MKVNLTSQRSTTTYSCDICKDTGWILKEVPGYQPTAIKCSCVDKTKTEKLWERYGVKPNQVKKINEYETYDKLTIRAKNKASNYVFSFEKVKSNENNWLAMMGQPGSGKSHLVIAIGAALIKKRLTVMYMPYMEVIKELKGNSINIEKYNVILERYTKCDVLIIDDLFKDKVKNGQLIGDLTEVDMKHIYPILNYRYYNSLPTIFSSECTPEMLTNLDRALAGRILERSCENIVVFDSEKYDFRIKKFLKQ